VDNKDRIELIFSIARANMTPEEIKSDLQAILKRTNSTKEDTYLSSNFDLALIESSATTTTFRLSMKQLASENDSGAYYLKFKSSGERSPNSVVINVENNSFFLSELPESLEVCEGEAVRLSCKCTKIVSSFEWLKDGAKLAFKEDKYKKDKLVYSFEVKAAKLSDTGMYEFRCAEGSGKGASQCAVTVKERPEKIVAGLKNVE